MTKEDMVQVLRSVGVNENTVLAMSNAFDMGLQYEKERILDVIGDNQCECNCADVVRNKRTP
jgi:hypothetical protein